MTQATETNGGAEGPAKIQPVSFEWVDHVNELKDFTDRNLIGFNWGTLEFNEEEKEQLETLRPFFGDRVLITIVFYQGQERTDETKPMPSFTVLRDKAKGE